MHAMIMKRLIITTMIMVAVSFLTGGGRVSLERVRSCLLTSTQLSISNLDAMQSLEVGRRGRRTLLSHKQSLQQACITCAKHRVAPLIAHMHHPSVHEVRVRTDVSKHAQSSHDVSIK